MPAPCQTSYSLKLPLHTYLLGNDTGHSCFTRLLFEQIRLRRTSDRNITKLWKYHSGRTFGLRWLHTGMKNNPIRRKLDHDVDKLRLVSPISLVPTTLLSGRYIMFMSLTSIYIAYLKLLVCVASFTDVLRSDFHIKVVRHFHNKSEIIPTSPQ